MTAVGTTLLVIASLYGGGAFLWNEFAHASDITQIQTQINDKNVQDLQDKIFLYEFKVNEGTANSLDKALLERHKSQLSRIIQQ